MNMMDSFNETLQSELANKGQGDPLAVGRVSYIGNGFVRVRLTGASPKLESLLYAEQPAPVAAVMPNFDTWYAKNRGVIGTAIYKNERKVWNACLDEFARLNSEPKP